MWTIGLVAHDNKKKELINWVSYNADVLKEHNLFSTGTTGLHIMNNCPGVNVTRLKSGPIGGDQQVGSMIANEELDILIFFPDPLEAQPHDTDVKALLRLAQVYNIPVACNRETANFIISSHLFFVQGDNNE